MTEDLQRFRDENTASIWAEILAAAGYGSIQRRVAANAETGRLEVGDAVKVLADGTVTHAAPPPDRLSVQADSPFYDASTVKRVRVWFKGTERTNVVEYCVSERWVYLQRKDTRMRPLWKDGKHVTIKLQGDVRVEWKWRGDKCEA